MIKFYVTMTETMIAEQFRRAIVRVGLTQTGAARFFGVNERTVRRWADQEGEGPPGPVVKLLRLMMRMKWSAVEADERIYGKAE